VCVITFKLVLMREREQKENNKKHNLIFNFKIKLCSLLLYNYL